MKITDHPDLLQARAYLDINVLKFERLFARVHRRPLGGQEVKALLALDGAIQVSTYRIIELSSGFNADGTMVRWDNPGKAVDGWTFNAGLFVGTIDKAFNRDLYWEHSPSIDYETFPFEGPKTPGFLVRSRLAVVP